jgi:predicted small secreted protein
LNLRKAALSTFALLALTLTSCDTVRRAGKDLTVAVLSPGIVLYGAATDAVDTTDQAREALGGGAVMQTITLPFAFLWRGIVHTLYCGAHAVDFFFFPVYGLADLHPNGPKIEPLDFYQGTWFDRETDTTSVPDAQSGEEVRSETPRR